MAENYTRFAQDEPNAELLERFIDGELRDELLFREALRRDLQYRDAAVEQRIIRNMRFLDAQTDASDEELIEQGYALRLHLTDEVIRRRLVQIMERLIVATAPSATPTMDQIQARYQEAQGSCRSSGGLLEGCAGLYPALGSGTVPSAIQPSRMASAASANC